MGFKGVPDSDGSIEIGYGINPAYHGHGYATEMVHAMVSWALGQPAVSRVTAETREDNQASIRVLEKVGFRRIGARLEPEDGPLIIWERTV